MRNHRLFLNQRIHLNKELKINQKKTHYLKHVLRLKKEEKITIFNGTGCEFIALIIQIKRSEITLKPVKKIHRNVESPLYIHLAQGISRNDRMDFVVQKSTELGIKRITPLLTEFSFVKLNTEAFIKKKEHWGKISQSACEQCGRNEIPLIENPMTIKSFFNNISNENSLLLLEPESKRTLEKTEKPKKGIDLLIGPEGGFSKKEIQSAREFGFSGISLGPRILRTETASLAAISIIQAKWGDFKT